MNIKRFNNIEDGINYAFEHNLDKFQVGGSIIYVDDVSDYDVDSMPMYQVGGEVGFSDFIYRQFGEPVEFNYDVYREGGININPANKGKFTESARRAGMTTQEFARHVLANKEDYGLTQVRRANFARNAAKWNKQLGGSVDPMDSFMDFYDRDQTSKRMADQAIFNTENQQLTQMQQMNEQQRKAGLEGILKGGFSVATSLINPLGSAGKALKGVGKVLGMEQGGWIKDVSESMEREGTKGAFTRQAKTRGMTAQEFARKVLANKENYDTTTVRRANLARTFANMQLGGYYQTIEEMYGGTVDPRQYYYQDGGEAEMMEAQMQPQPEQPDTESLYSPDFQSPWADSGTSPADNSLQQSYEYNDMFNDQMSNFNNARSSSNILDMPIGGDDAEGLGLPEAVAASLPPGYYEQQRTVQGLMPGKQIATQHNNPGNIKYGQFAAKYGAVPGKRATDGGVFALFPTVEAGLEAHKNLLKTGKYYRNQPLDKALKTWSGNGYGDNIVPHLRGKKVSELTDAEFNEVMMAQHKIESPEMYRILYGRK